MLRGTLRSCVLYVLYGFMKGVESFGVSEYLSTCNFCRRIQQQCLMYSISASQKPISAFLFLQKQSRQLVQAAILNTRRFRRSAGYFRTRVVCILHFAWLCVEGASPVGGPLLQAPLQTIRRFRKNQDHISLSLSIYRYTPPTVYCDRQQTSIQSTLVYCRSSMLLLCPLSRV